ncbi:feruloyl-CoA synthase [Rhizobium bangladeshense]|uniref:feruloyl-CoA synthase n=1 Tax=Rhizobium bangladeshense TaxID=1138189 RepID=UPI0007E5A891|nr:feruloyl-CoA synthase [Rhizobium bangladeshense]
MTERPRQTFKLWSPRLKWERRSDGTIIMRREDQLGPYPRCMNERFVHWAESDPDRVWMAERDDRGNWRKMTYGEGLKKIRHIGQALLDLGLSVERPLMILSENSIEHALMALGAQHVGIPSAAVTPAYATADPGFGKLRDIARQMTPGAVFVGDGLAFSSAIDAAFGTDLPVISVCALPSRQHASIRFETLLKTDMGPHVERAFLAVGPDTVAKFLFTSGTTGAPKAVTQTQRMLCANQEMIADCYAFLRDEPPVIVDWAPWTHTAGGNKVFNLVIYNGGTFYLDRGKPTQSLIGDTIANLRDVSPNWYFNVPAGYEMLVDAMRRDDGLRDSFFRNLKILMYAGASMAQHTWDALTEFSKQVSGGQMLICTGLGSTETGPFSLFCTEPQESPGNIGIPAQGITLKLVPIEDKYELRLTGPNITPGYWRDPKLTAEAFDEEGFYMIGDAVRLAVPGDPTSGFYFEGRTAENFKLRTGTWVSVGKLRAELIDQFGGLIRDVIITGEDRAELGALAIPVLEALRNAVGDAGQLSDEAVLSHPDVKALLAGRLAEHQRNASGSSTRIMRLMLLREPPRLDKGEITDKGSLNQRAMRTHRADLIEALYAGAPDVILASKEVTA